MSLLDALLHLRDLKGVSETSPPSPPTPPATPQPPLDVADAALTVLYRLRAYTLPGGRMPAAYAIVNWLRPLLTTPDLDPAQALAALGAVETELTALGGEFDAELARAIGLTTAVYSGTRLVEVRKLH